MHPEEAGERSRILFKTVERNSNMSHAYFGHVGCRASSSSDAPRLDPSELKVLTAAILALEPAAPASARPRDNSTVCSAQGDVASDAGDEVQQEGEAVGVEDGKAGRDL